MLAETQKLSSFWMPERASTVAANVDGLYDFIYYLSLFFFLLITILLVVFCIKYRHREGAPERESAAGHSTALELTWTIIPTILVLVIFYMGFRGFINMMVEPPNSYEVLVTGRTWSWTFTYEGKYASDDNKLHIPVNTPVRFVLSSNDVIHSLFMPVFRVKKDVVPGRYNRFWVEATQIGEYEIYCAEYCGNLHSQMLSKVVVESRADFEKYLERIRDWTKTKTPLEAGEMLFNTRGCAGCHSVSPGKEKIVGPPLRDMFGSQVPIVGAGNVLADENYIRESILYPQAKVHQGFGPPSQMPSFLGQLNDNDIMAIISYMKSISTNFKGDLSPFKQKITPGATPGAPGATAAPGAATAPPTPAAPAKNAGAADAPK